MASRSFDFNRRALTELADSGDMEEALARYSVRVRDKARRNADAISRRLADAIEVEAGHDRKGNFADVGYLKTAPGFVLWWHEVGTRRYPSHPHLRPALEGNR